MPYGLAMLVTETVRHLSATSPLNAALFAELGADRAAAVIHRVLDAMTPEERRQAVMAAMAGQAQLAADVIRLDAEGDYDRGGDLLGNAAGALRMAVGQVTGPADPPRRKLGMLDI